MCHAIRCEICGEIMYFEEYYEHIKSCKPELEKAEIKVKVRKTK